MRPAPHMASQSGSDMREPSADDSQPAMPASENGVEVEATNDAENNVESVFENSMTGSSSRF